MHQIRVLLGLCPTPHWGAYSAPPDLLGIFNGPTSKEREGSRRGGEGKVKWMEGERRWREGFGPLKNFGIASRNINNRAPQSLNLALLSTMELCAFVT